jgi:hypothetical protein
MKEHNWPGPVAEATYIYAGFHDDIHARADNIICACCGCIEHMFSDVEIVPVIESYLAVLAVNSEHKPIFTFASGIPALDSRNIMINRNGIFLSDEIHDPLLTIHKPCCYKLQKNQLPPQALANYRWIG